MDPDRDGKGGGGGKEWEVRRGKEGVWTRQRRGIAFCYGSVATWFTTPKRFVRTVNS